MATYRPTIGLEIHAELKTRTKMFCASKNDPDEERPNTNVCPVCMAYPGTLPVVNREAVRHVLRVGVAVGGTLATFTEFDRKNYFYPDLPKGYQISQYQYPLVSGGSILGVQLTRIHLEEDTANSKHQGEYSLVDFNRAGIPLMELVTEPVIHDATTAGAFARELQLILRMLGVADANMEKGQMRVEANISVSATDAFGTKVEVKNLNSFKSVERSIEYEIKRQIELLEGGGQVVQETRGFDEDRGVTFSQRLKESSHDYRYFPDPDIPKLNISSIPEFGVEVLRASMPELPLAKRTRYQADGLRSDEIEILLNNPEYEAVHHASIESESDAGVRAISRNLLLGEVRSRQPDAEALSHVKGVIVEVARMQSGGIISATAAKAVLAAIMADGGTPKETAERLGLFQVTDSAALEKIVADVLAEHKAVVDELRAGKAAAIQFLIGQGMKKSKGAASPELLRDLIHKQVGI